MKEATGNSILWFRGRLNAEEPEPSAFLEFPVAI